MAVRPISEHRRRRHVVASEKLLFSLRLFPVRRKVETLDDHRPDDSVSRDLPVDLIRLQSAVDPIRLVTRL